MQHVPFLKEVHTDQWQHKTVQILKDQRFDEPSVIEIFCGENLFEISHV